MKNKILLSAIFGITSLTSAEYIAKFPLELVNGGALPNNSIIFTNNQPQPTTECTAMGLSVDCDERLNAWELFADSNSLNKDWNSIYWSNESLTYIPTEPYPLTITNGLYFSNNQLNNVDGLISLITVNGYLNLSNNPINNLDGLSNLRLITSDLYIINNNSLTNINGLRNVKVNNWIAIDNSYSGPKIAANERFCTENDSAIFYPGYATKSQLCFIE